MSRLRELVRGRVSVLADSRKRADAARSVLGDALPPGVPLAAVDLCGVEGAGPVLESLAWTAGDLWLVRPDAHTAARVGRPQDLVPAARRMLGLAGP